MSEHAGAVEVKTMCQVFGISRSGYYAWVKNPLRPRQKQDMELAPVVRRVFDGGRQTYGTRRIGAIMAGMRMPIGRRRIRRLMKLQRLYPKTAKAYRHAITQRSAHPQSTPDLLKRNFSVNAPNRVWTGDITQVATLEGMLYLAVIEDLYSRYIVGWSMLEQQTAFLVVLALRMACTRRHPQAGCIFHSDKGTQYDCVEFRQVLQEHRFRQSMGSAGDCYDNAVTESAIGTVKSECCFDKVFKTREVARSELFDYIETFYNRLRLHSTLGYRSPEDFERRAVEG
jgi:putative transposase